MKKLLSLLLAAVLMVSLCVVAFADAAVTLDDVKGDVTTVIIGKGLSTIPEGALSVFPNCKTLVTGSSVNSVNPASGLKSGMSVETAGNPDVFAAFDVKVIEISDEDYEARLAKVADGKSGNGFIFKDGTIVLQNYGFLTKSTVYGWTGAGTGTGSDSESSDFVIRESGSEDWGSWETISYWDKDPDKNSDAKLIKVERNEEFTDGSEFHSTTSDFKEYNGKFYPGKSSHTVKDADGTTTEEADFTYQYNDDFTERTIKGTVTNSEGTEQVEVKQYWNPEKNKWQTNPLSDELV